MEARSTSYVEGETTCLEEQVKFGVGQETGTGGASCICVSTKTCLYMTES